MNSSEKKTHTPDPIYVQDLNTLTSQVIGAAIDVHRALGPGLLESAYQECLAREFDLRALPYHRQHSLPVSYKGLDLDCGYRLDFLVAQTLVVEIKSVAAVLPLHTAQVLTYLRLGNWPLGLLLNFNVDILKAGVRRIALSPKISAPSAPPQSTLGQS